MAKLIKMPKLILFSVVLLCSLATLVESLPAAKPDDIKSLDDVKDAWDKNDYHEFEINGKTYQLSTRDIILISAASLIVLLILICCIGFCLCECVKNLICCICCCRDC